MKYFFPVNLSYVHLILDWPKNLEGKKSFPSVQSGAQHGSLHGLDTTGSGAAAAERSWGLQEEWQKVRILITQPPGSLPAGSSGSDSGASPFPKLR